MLLVAGHIWGNVKGSPEPRIRGINEVENAVLQPPPGAVLEHSGLGVDAEFLVEIQLGGDPVGEDVGPFDLHLRLGSGGRGAVVPVAESGFWVVRSTAWVVWAVGTGVGVVGAVWASYFFFRGPGLGPGFGMFFGVGLGVGWLVCSSCVAVSPFPRDSQCSRATFSPMP